MNNVHRVTVPIQPEGDDRRRRSDDGRNGCLLVLIPFIAVDTDRLSAPENARTAAKKDVRDFAVGGFVCNRRCSGDGCSIFVLHFAWPRAGFEDHRRQWLLHRFR